MLRYSMSIVESIALEIQKLTPQQQESVLLYARSMTQRLPKGARLADLMQFAGTIPTEELRQMQDAIEEACERVTPNA
jgi:hypothetical protein